MTSRQEPWEYCLERMLCQDDGCWVWTGSLNQDGYGLAWQTDRHVIAHRLYYTLMVGPIPPGMQLDHLCRNRRCIRPDHLEPVTQAENAARGGPFNRHTTCMRGHMLEVRGRRQRCLTCSREWMRAKRARKQGETDGS